MTTDDVGKRVLSASDRRIGTVGRVHGRAFELLLERGGTLWLKEDCIFVREERSLTLICEEAGLSRYGVSVPGESAIS